METVWVSRGEDTRLIERRHLSTYKEQGFEQCPKPVQAPAVEEPGKPKTNLVTLYKDGDECQSEKFQVAAMEAAGWSATKGATDASRGLEQQGRKLDQEHGSGEHGDEPGDEKVGVEQPKGNRRNRPYRRKRGNDEDS